MQELNCTLIPNTDNENFSLLLLFSVESVQLLAKEAERGTKIVGKAALPAVLKAQAAHRDRFPHYSWSFTRLPHLCDVVRSFD